MNNRSYYILISGLLILSIIAFILDGYGFQLGDTIAISSSLLAFMGLIYTNYRNDIMVRKQVEKADERLQIQLKTEVDNLTVELANQDERLKKELEEQKEVIREQLRYSEKNLKLELRYKDKERVLLDLFDLLFKNKDSLEDIESESLVKSTDSVIESRKNIYYSFEITRHNIHDFYYMPKNIRHLIEDYCNTINNVKDQGSNNPDFSKDKSIILNSQLLKHLNKIYESVEEDLDIKMDRFD